MPDGSAVRYSPNWCGDREKCAKNEKALLYNDKELWGIGQADGDYVPNDVKVISKEQAIKLISDVFDANPNSVNITNDGQVIIKIPIKDAEGVYAGEKLVHRWDNKPTAYCKDLIINFDGKTWPKQLKYSPEQKPFTLPKYLVKYLKAEHLEKFVNTGEILISSIARFRTMEGYGKDEKEGIKNSDICIELGEPTVFKATELGKLIAHFKLQGSGSIEVNGKIIIHDKTYLPDAYVFCTSYKPVNEFGRANYKIVNIPRFAQTLFESIRKEVDDGVYSWMMAPVIYGGTKDTINTITELRSLGNYNINMATMLDCFYKPLSFKDEEEFRFVFFTKKQTIEKMKLIHNRNLIKYCNF